MRRWRIVDILAHISAVCDDEDTTVSVNGSVEHLSYALCSIFRSVLECESFDESDLYYLVIMAANLVDFPE